MTEGSGGSMWDPSLQCPCHFGNIRATNFGQTTPPDVFPFDKVVESNKN